MPSTFRVNYLDYTTILSNKQPDDNLNNIIYQLEQATIWITDQPLKHGNTFTVQSNVTGAMAKQVYGNLIVAISPLTVRAATVSTDGVTLDITFSNNVIGHTSLPGGRRTATPSTPLSFRAKPSSCPTAPGT